MIRHLLILSILLASCSFAQTARPAGNKEELQKHVEDFFAHNYKDITARTTIEWGEATIDEQGHKSIRYQYEATIWDKEKILENKVFTFDSDGKFVSAESLPGFPKELGAASAATQPAAEAQPVEKWLQSRVEDFLLRNYKDITAREDVDWGEAMIDAEGNLSIRYRCTVTIWEKEKKPFDKTFVFTTSGKFVRTK